MLTINHVGRLSDDLLIEGHQLLRLFGCEHDRMQIQHAEPLFSARLSVPTASSIGTACKLVHDNLLQRRDSTSPKFGQVVFEHDSCACWNHRDSHGNQSGTSWIKKEKK